MQIPDTTTWDWLISERDKFLARSNASEDTKEMIIRGYKEIRSILGEDFLRKRSNSMIPSLCNFALWSLLKNADFGQKLGMLKGRKNFEDIKKDILQDNFENAFGAEAAVEIVGDFLKKDFEIDLIECKKSKRTPDFKVKVENKWIYFEITTFRTYPDEIESISDFCFKLQKNIDQLCLNHERFIEVDFNGMTRGDAEGCFDSIISKASEIVQSPEESEAVVCGAKLKSLKKEEGYGPPYIHGIRKTTDEMVSISRKLLEKLNRKQLPDGECTVLLIFTRSPFLPDFQVLAEGLSQCFSTKTNPSAAVVHYICPERLNLSVGDDKFKIIHRTEHDDLYNRYNIIIPNPSCDSAFGLSDCDIRALFGH